MIVTTSIPKEKYKNYANPLDNSDMLVPPLREVETSYYISLKQNKI